MWVVASLTLTLARDDGTVVCERVHVASSPFARARGLLGRSRLAPTEGLLIRRTRGIHTHFMRFAIDVLFIDGDGTVVKLMQDLKPWRASSCRRGRDVVELAAGSAARVALRVGDRVVLEPGVERAT
jgi:uncharacterized protein